MRAFVARTPIARLALPSAALADILRPATGPEGLARPGPCRSSARLAVVPPSPWVASWRPARPSGSLAVSLGTTVITLAATGRPRRPRCAAARRSRSPQSAYEKSRANWRSRGPVRPPERPMDNPGGRAVANICHRTPRPVFPVASLGRRLREGTRTGSP